MSTAAVQKDYWNAFKNFLRQSHPELKPRKEEKHHMDFGVGLPHAHVTARFSPGSAQGSKAEMELTLSGAEGEALWTKLKAEGDVAAKKRLGRDVIWKQPPATSRAGTVDPEWGVVIRRPIDAELRSRWPELHEWMACAVREMTDWIAAPRQSNAK